MRRILAAARSRVVDNPRTTLAGVLALLVVLLLALGARAIDALTVEVTALDGLLSALSNGWQALVGLPVAGWLLLSKDRRP